MKRTALLILVLTLLALPLAMRAQPEWPLRFEPAKELVGTLSAEIADNFEKHTSETRFYLTTDDGKRFEILIEDGLRTGQLGARVKMKARKVQGEPLFLTRSGDVEVLADFRTEVAGSLRVAVVLLDFSDSPATRPFTAASVQNTTFSTVRSYYQEVSFGTISNLEVTVFDWIRLSDETSSPCDSNDWGNKARAYWTGQGVDFSQFNYVVHIFPQTNACTFGGLGQTPGPYTWINGFLGGIIHELGHNFGALHAGGCFGYPYSASQPCSSIETYADFFDVMGTNQFPHMGAFHKRIAGWSPTVQDVAAVSGTSQDFEIYPIEFREGASLQALRAPTSSYGGGYLWVEYRQPYGFDAPFGSSADGVILRYVPPGPIPSNSASLGPGFVDTALIETVPNGAFNDDALKPGQVFSDMVNGIHVSFLGTVDYAPGKKKAVVRLSFGPTAPPPPSCRRAPQLSITQVDPDTVRKRAYDVQIVNRDLAFGECVNKPPKFTLSFTEPPSSGRWKHKPSTYTTPALATGQGTVRRVKIFPKDSLPVGSLHTFMESVTSNRSTVHSVSIPGSYRVGNNTGTSVGTTASTDTPYPDLKVAGLDDAEVAVTSGTNVSVSWTSQFASSCTLTRNGTSIATGLSGSRTELINSARTYALTCTASDGSTATDTISVVTQVNQPPAQTPFLGAPFAVPGTIQAEDFDNGGEGVAWHDTDPGNGWGVYRTNVDVDIAPGSDAGDIGGGYVAANAWAGEWMEYTVNVASAGTYTFEARVASDGPGGIFHVEFGGIDRTGPIQVPNTGGWGSWQTISRTVNLSAGQQVMRVSLDSNGFQPYPAIADLNYFRLTSAAAGGTGLTGSYFSNTSLAGAPILARVEGPIDFAWGANSPSPGIVDIDNFGVRWTGRIQAPTSETYTFWIFSDDGVRLWVNGVLLLDRWFDQYGPETASTPITLQAGQSYNITLEYYERWAGAEVHLSWSSPSTPKQIVPMSRLFPQ